MAVGVGGCYTGERGGHGESRARSGGGCDKRVSMARSGRRRPDAERRAGCGSGQGEGWGAPSSRKMGAASRENTSTRRSHITRWQPSWEQRTIMWWRSEQCRAWLARDGEARCYGR
jgi:hypothetical protein